jgi:hypothetical protein
VLLPSKYLKDCIIDALIKNRRALAKKAEKFVHLYNLEPPPQMSGEDRKSYMNQRRAELYDPTQPFGYYLHGKQETPTSTDVLVFAHPAVQGVHMAHWYESKKSPLCDREMRSLMSTTTIHMLSGSATAVSEVYFGFHSLTPFV